MYLEFRGVAQVFGGIYRFTQIAADPQSRSGPLSGHSIQNARTFFSLKLVLVVLSF